MRILHVLTLVDDGGTHGGPLAAALAQCAELRRRGHDVQLLAPWRGDGEPPAQVEQVPARLFTAGAGHHRLLTWLRRNAGHFDLAHVHVSRSLVPLRACAALRRAGVPFVVQTHGGWRPAGDRRGRLLDAAFTGPALRGAGRRLVTDVAERQSLTIITRSPSGIVPLRSAVALAAPATGSGSPLADVLFLARLHPDKQVLTFARAAERLVADGVEARFCVVGPDGGDRAALRAFLADRPELADRLVDEGPLPHEAALRRLARCDLMVHPARDGRPSMAVLEALAAGVPVVVTTDYSHALTLRARRAARVVRPGPEPLTRAVRDLINNPGPRGDLARRGRVAATRAFGIGAQVDELEVHYREVLDGAGEQGVPRAPTPPVEQPLTQRTLLWVTTEVTPYRLSLWREVAQLTRLTVALLADSRPNWRLHLDSDGEPFDVVQLRARVQGEADGLALFAAARPLRALIRQGPEAMVLDGWDCPAFLAAARWARRRRIPVVASYHGAGPRATNEDVDQPAPGRDGEQRGEPAGEPRAQPAGVDQLRRRQRLARRSLLRHADAVLTGNSGVDAVLRLGVPADKITLGPVDAAPASGTDRPVPVARVIDLRESHRFLYLGPLTTPANVGGLLQAFALVRTGNDTLTLAGAGPQVPMLRARALELGVREAVTFVEEPDDEQRAAALRVAHTLVLPSGALPDDGTATQALGAGLHVVAVPLDEQVQAVSTPTLFPAEPTPWGLARAMVASRQQWRRPRVLPLDRRPGDLADAVVGAVAGATARRDVAGRESSARDRQRS